MLHAHDFASTPPKRFLPRKPDATPLAPWEYLKLRRKAAGLQVRDLAKRLADRRAYLIAAGEPLPDALGRLAAADMTALVLMLEATGSRARLRDTLDAIAAVIPFDPEVYLQLADAAPKRHPRVCRDCGCSAHDECHHERWGSCSWSTPAQCSHCAKKAEG